MYALVVVNVNLNSIVTVNRLTGHHSNRKPSFLLIALTPDRLVSHIVVEQFLLAGVTFIAQHM